MKNKIKIGLIIFSLIVIVISGIINFKINKNTNYIIDRLKENKYTMGKVDLLLDFDYDYVYILMPNQSKREMESFIGIKVFQLKESTEDMINLLFIKDGKAVAYLYGDTRDYGFIVKIEEDENLKLSKLDFGKMTYKMKNMRKENPVYKKYVFYWRD